MPSPLTAENSFGSDSSSLTDLSTSSFSSVGSDDFIVTVRESMEDYKVSERLVYAERQARKMIQRLADAPEEDGQIPDLYSNPAVPNVTVKLHKVLEAMLANAEACGGSHGKRYTLAAICTAGRSSGDGIQSLSRLGITWLSHFLWVCE